MQAYIQNIIPETFDTKSFIIKLSDSSILEKYKAGQFIILSSIQSSERRSYSIVNIIDFAAGIIQITVKRIENGYFSRLLFDETQLGDTFLVHGISGMFTLPDSLSQYTHVNFYAAGSGITPAFAVISTILSHHPDIQIRLYYATKAPQKTIFQRELDQLALQHPSQLKITYFYSESNDILNARLNNTKLSQILSLNTTEMLAQQLFYICGPTDYMDMVSITLLTEGVPKANIKKEQFATFVPELDELPPDTTTRKVRIHYAKNEIKDVNVTFPNSILDSAQEASIAVPYSCKSGQCGSCAARIIKGEVWMSYNEVLTDKDIEQGLTLTCRGYPINGDVEISYI